MNPSHEHPQCGSGSPSQYRTPCQPHPGRRTAHYSKDTREAPLLQMDPLLPQQIDQTPWGTHQNVNAFTQNAMLRLGGFSTPHTQHTMHQPSVRCKHVLHMRDARRRHGIERLCRFLHKGEGEGKGRRHVVRKLVQDLVREFTRGNDDYCRGTRRIGSQWCVHQHPQ